MLSAKLENALNEQINAELWSGYLYLSMSICAARNGMPGLSHWMFIQWQEEQTHARRIQLYMLSRNANVQLQAIAAVPTEWEDAQEMLREALMHEQEITAMIDSLMTMAYEENDYATINHLTWFVDEQIEEEQQVRDILSHLNMVEDDVCGLYQIDQQLLQRKA